jgi:hypothetical protein
MKPTAELIIVRTISGATSYRLYHGRQLVWSTRAYSTEVGKDGARERLRQWLQAHPYTIVLAAYQEVAQPKAGVTTERKSLPLSGKGVNSTA